MSKPVEDALSKIVDSLHDLPYDTKDMVKQLRVVAQGLTKINVAELTKTATSAEEAAKILGNERKQSRKSFEKEAKNNEDNSKKTKESFTMLDLALKNASTGITRFGQSIATTDGSFQSLTNALSNIPIIGAGFAALGFLSATVDETISAYRTVTQSGVQFQNGILGLLETSGELGLGFKETAEMFKQYNTTIQRIGTPAFTGFIKEVRKNASNLYALGFTYSDIVKSSAEFLETQRNLTGLRALNEREQEQLFNQTVEEFYKASQLTGVGVTELLGKLNKESEDARKRLILNSLPEEGRNMLIALSEVNPQLYETALEALQKGALERVDRYGDVLISGTEPLIREIINISKTSNASAKGLRDIFKAYEPLLKARAGNLAVSGLDSALAIAAGAAKTSNDLIEGIPKAAKDAEIDPETEKILQMGPAINEALAQVRASLLNVAVDVLGPDSAIGQLITDGLKGFVDMVSNPENIAVLNNFIDGVKQLHAVLSSMSSDVMGMFGVESPLGASLVGGIGILLAGKIAMWTAGLVTKNVFGLMFDGISSIVGRGVRRSPLGRFAKLAGVAAVAGAGYMAYKSYTKDLEDEEPQPVVPETDETPAPINSDIAPSQETQFAEKQDEEQTVQSVAIFPDPIVDETEEIVASQPASVADKSIDSVVPQQSVQSVTSELNSTLSDDIAGVGSDNIKTLEDLTRSLNDILKRRTTTGNNSTDNNSTDIEIQTDRLLIQPLGVPNITTAQNTTLQPTSTVVYEKRILELTEEGAEYSKILAATSMAVAQQTKNTYNTITSSVV